MEDKGKFACCINCIDGRVQVPVISWIKDNYGVDYVDMITEPGVDAYIQDENNELKELLDKIRISVSKHGSDKVFVVGHFDCAANPVDEQVHKEHILRSVQRLEKHLTHQQIIGLWVSEDFEIQMIS